jgi:uncharacterized membrane protein
VSAQPSPRLLAMAATAARLETIAARLLTWGTRIALGLILLGVVGMAVTGVQPLSGGTFPPYSLAAIPGQIAALEPEGFIWAGLTLLVALPLGRVTVSGAGFLAAHDRRLALVSVLVLLVIAASITAALGLEG